MNKLVSKRFISVIMLVAMTLCLFTGCNKPKNMKVDEPITYDTVNISSANVAEGFVQSIFTNDRPMFYKVFPSAAFEAMIEEEGIDPFLEYVSTLDGDYEYYGAEFTAANPFTDENGYDSEWMKANISEFHKVDLEAINEMEIVKLRIYFYSASAEEYQASDVYILTYKTDGSWYTYEMANYDSDFKA